MKINTFEIGKNKYQYCMPNSLDIMSYATSYALACEQKDTKLKDEVHINLLKLLEVNGRALSSEHELNSHFNSNVKDLNVARNHLLENVVYAFFLE